MNNITTYEKEEKINIKDLIYTIRGKQVMLDSDLAVLYGCKNGTKDVNKAVKRNIDKFPSDFYFQLSKEEYYNILRFQNGTLEFEQGRYSKYLPFVFTEQGVAMLASVLRTEKANTISVNIMRAFVEMRKFLMINSNIFERLTNVEYKMLDYDKKFDYLFNQFEIGENIKQRIFFDGQIYDAYSLIVSIIEKSNKSILIIDNYVDISVLDMLSKKKENVKVKIITGESCKLKEIDINKFNKEYPNLEVIKTNKFHDRFIIIDETDMYHLGASIKDAGNKIFGINKIEDKYLIDKIISFSINENFMV